MKPTPRRKPEVRDDYDGAWKYLLHQKRFFWFTAFFTPDIHTDLDTSREAEFLEQELLSIFGKRKKGTFHVDCLARVWTKRNKERWILTLVEVQAWFDEDINLRLLEYFVRLLRKYRDIEIVVILVLADDDPEWRPDGFHCKAWDTRLDFNFRVIKLTDYQNRIEELEADPNPFGRFVVAHLKTRQTKGKYETRLEWKLRLMQGLYSQGYPEQDLVECLLCIDWMMRLPERLETKMEQAIKKFEQEETMPYVSSFERIARRNGLREGRREGKREGYQETLLQLLDQRAGDVPLPLKESILGMKSEKNVQQLLNLAIDNLDNPTLLELIESSHLLTIEKEKNTQPISDAQESEIGLV